MEHKLRGIFINKQIVTNFRLCYYNRQHKKKKKQAQTWSPVYIEALSMRKFRVRAQEYNPQKAAAHPEGKEVPR